MNRIPGPTGLSPAHAVPIDRGTSVRHRHHAPAHRHRAPKPRFDPHRPLTVDETSILQALDAEKIVDLNERAMFLAQMSHESQDFTRFEENLNYKPAGLLKTFPRHFKDSADAEQVVKDGKTAIAERIYGGRMGNTADGDGGLYYGRGYIQLTGKTRYEQAGTALCVDLVNHPELAAQRPTALRVAIWYWQSQNIGPAGRLGDVRTATMQINGGTNGLADRTVRFGRYKAILEVLAHPEPVAPPGAPPAAPIIQVRP